MHHTQKNLIEIKEKIKDKIDNLNLSEYDPKIIAVSEANKESIFGRGDTLINKESFIKQPTLFTTST